MEKSKEKSKKFFEKIYFLYSHRKLISNINKKMMTT